MSKSKYRGRAEATSLEAYAPVVQTYIKAYTTGDSNPRTSPPELTRGIRYAVAQPPSQVAREGSIQEAIDFNIETLETACTIAADYNAQLIIFPELFLSGYEFGELREPPLSAEDIIYNDAIKLLVFNTASAIFQGHYINDVDDVFSPGPIAQIAKDNNIAIICPLPYQGDDPAGNPSVFDAAVVFDSDGTKLGMVFKLNLWGYSERNWFDVAQFSAGTAGSQEAYPIFEINGFPVGAAICYDAEFPENSRCMSLRGALLQAMPTAAPSGLLPGQTEPYPDISEHYIPANALTNQNFASYGNRSKWEYKSDGAGGSTGVLEFTGNSIICDPYGKAMVKAVRNEDALLIADCVICDYPSTQPSSTDYLLNRRPEIYANMTDAHVDFPYGTDGYDYLTDYTDNQGNDPVRPPASDNCCPAGDYSTACTVSAAAPKGKGKGRGKKKK